MKNRLLEMEGQLKQLRAPKWSYTRPLRRAKPPGRPNGNGHRAAPAPVAPPAVKAQAFGRYRMPISAMLSRALSYSVPGHVPPVAQDNPMACWAAVTTMMISWRDSAGYTIGEATSKIGVKWRDRYDLNKGLPSDEKAAFLAAAGLTVEPPGNYTIEKWETLLREYGPLWVTTNEGFGSPSWSAHARIVKGISGDGTPGGTTVDVVDPAGARTYLESFQTFVNKYEDDMRKHPDGATPRVQIVHWGRGARR